MLSRIYLVAAICSFLCCTSPTVTDKNNKSGIATADTLASFAWADETCEYSGNYDPRKYSTVLIKNTYELWHSNSGLLLENGPAVYEPADTAKLNLKALTAEYTAKKAHLQKLEIIDAPYWNKLKKELLQQLDEEYEFDRIEIQAFSNPQVLLNNRFSKSCERFVTALTATDTSVLLTGWRNFNEELRVRDSATGTYTAKATAKYGDSPNLTYVKIDLLTFGWANCANASVFHVTNDGTAEANYEKLFTNVKSVCEED